MKSFIAGVMVASLLWGGLFYAQKIHLIELFGDEAAVPEVDTASLQASADTDDDKEAGKRKRRRPGRKRSRARSDGPGPARTYNTEEAVSGDVLDGPGGKSLAMGQGGGEDQLSSQEIDQGIDRVFKGIERCLLTLPPDAPAAGKIVFGMNIASSGQVTKVNLQGPKHMITGETGSCFRRTVRSIRFRSFDGPDMVAHYPVTFE